MHFRGIHGSIRVLLEVFEFACAKVPYAESAVLLSLGLLSMSRLKQKTCG